MQKRMFFLFLCLLLIAGLIACSQTTIPTTSSTSNNPTTLTTATTSSGSTTTTSSSSVTTSSSTVTIQSVILDSTSQQSIWMVESFQWNQLRLRVQYSNGTHEFVVVTTSMVSTQNQDQVSKPGLHAITIQYQAFSIPINLYFESNALNQVLQDFYNEVNIPEPYPSWILSITGSSSVYIVSAQYNEAEELLVQLSNQTQINLGSKTDETFLVVFYGLNDEILKTQAVRSGQSATAPTLINRPNFVFQGWSHPLTNITQNTNIYALYRLNGYSNVDSVLYSLHRLNEAKIEFDFDNIFKAASNNQSPSVQSTKRLGFFLDSIQLNEPTDPFYNSTNFLEHPLWRGSYFHKSMYQLPESFQDHYIITSTLNSFNITALQNLYVVIEHTTKQARDMIDWALDKITVVDQWVIQENHQYLLHYNHEEDIVELNYVFTVSDWGLTSYRRIRIFYNARGEEVVEFWINELYTKGNYPGVLVYFNKVGDHDCNYYSFWLDESLEPNDNQFHFRGVNRNEQGGYDYYDNASSLISGLILGDYGWYSTELRYNPDTKTTSTIPNPYLFVYTPDAYSNVFSIMKSGNEFFVELYLPSMNGLEGVLFPKSGLLYGNQDSEAVREEIISRGLTPLPDRYTYDNDKFLLGEGIKTAKGVFWNTDPTWNQQVTHRRTFIYIGREGNRQFHEFQNYYATMWLNIHASTMEDALNILVDYLDYLGLSYKYGDTGGLISETIAFYESAEARTRQMKMATFDMVLSELPYVNDSDSYYKFLMHIQNFILIHPELKDIYDTVSKIPMHQMPPRLDLSYATLISLESRVSGVARIQEERLLTHGIKLQLSLSYLFQNNQPYQVVYAYQIGGKLYPIGYETDIIQFQGTTVDVALQTVIDLPTIMLPGEYQLVMYVAKVIDSGHIRITKPLPIPLIAFDSFTKSATHLESEWSVDCEFRFDNGSLSLTSVFIDRFPPKVMIQGQDGYYQAMGEHHLAQVPYGTTLQDILAMIHVLDNVDGTMEILQNHLFFGDDPIVSFDELVQSGEYRLVLTDSSGNTTTIVFKDVLVYCTIAFYDHEGTLLSSSDVPYGQDIEFPVLETRTGYTFVDWDLDVVQAKDHYDFHPVYEINRHSVTFMIDDEVYEVVENVAYQEEIQLIQVEKIGHTLVWEEYPIVMPDEPLTIRGYFIPNRHSLTIYIENEIHQIVEEVPYGEVLQMPVVPKEGYSLIWSPILETMPDEDTIIYGTYEINHHSVSFYIDGVLHSHEEYAFGEVIVYPVVEQTGYTLVWDEIIDTLPDENITIYGGFIVNRHMVFFYINQALHHAEEYAYGEPILFPTISPEEGYYFSGWDPSNIETMMDSDLIFNGSILPQETE